jgi:hypothetical protein
MAELTPREPSPDCVFGTKAGIKSCKLPSEEDTGTSPLNPHDKLIYVRYRDHVFFKNVQTPAAEAIIREALGWVKKETDEIMLIECDRPLLQGFSGFNGVVVLKNCIICMLPLNFEHILNSQTAIIKNRVGASSQRSEKLSPKKPPEGQK